MKNAHAKRAKLLVVIVKYANLKCFELFLKSSKLLIDLISIVECIQEGTRRNNLATFNFT